MIFHWPWQSGEQAAVRDAMMEKAGGKCMECGGVPEPMKDGRTRLQIHHERYEGELTLADVRLLCDRCHRRLHGRSGEDAPRRPLSNHPDAMEGSPFYTVEQAAAILQISRSHAYELIRVGRIPHVKLGSLVRIPRSALEALEESAEAPRLRVAR